MELKDSRTAKNLLKAFIARKEGLEHVAAILLETAENEKEHAKLFFKHLAPLAPSTIEITGSWPAVAGDTAASTTTW